MTIHLIAANHSKFFWMLKGILFGFKSVCGKQFKGEGLWDASRANCPDCIKIFEPRGVEGKEGEK